MTNPTFSFGPCGMSPQLVERRLHDHVFSKCTLLNRDGMARQTPKRTLVLIHSEGTRAVHLRHAGKQTDQYGGPGSKIQEFTWWMNSGIESSVTVTHPVREQFGHIHPH